MHISDLNKKTTKKHNVPKVLNKYLISITLHIWNTKNDSQLWRNEDES